jgi:hypothetical protein
MRQGITKIIDIAAAYSVVHDIGIHFFNYDTLLMFLLFFALSILYFWLSFVNHVM